MVILVSDELGYKTHPQKMAEHIVILD